MSSKFKQLAIKGTAKLHKAVLGVLLDARKNEHCIGAAALSKKAGLYREAGVVHMNDSLAHGCLNELHEQGKVERCKQSNRRGGWKLTEEEYNRRRSDS